MFQALHRELNRAHGTHHTDRFWRLLIGPWLYTYVYILYERWICLRIAAQDPSQPHTHIIPASTQWVPADHAQFLGWIASDAYNLFLYSRLIEETRLIPFAMRSDPEIVPPSENRHATKNPKKFLRGRVFFTDSQLIWKDHVRLMLRARLWLCQVAQTTPIPATVPNLERRAALKQLPLSGDFEHLAKQLMPACLPTAYLESFGQLCDRATQFLPASTRVIVGGNSLLTDDTVKCAAAFQQDQGATIAAVQHGGQYGLGAWNSDEDHETQAADFFYSWGGYFESAKAKPLDAFKLIKTQDIEASKRGPILLMLMSIPRYFHFAASVPISADFPNYLGTVERFVKALDAPSRKQLRIRRYPVDYGWDETQWMHAAIPDVPAVSSRESLYSQIKKSRLFVGTYNATTLIELLAANVPSVFFWDPAYWEIRPKAQPLIESLIHAGILWTASEAAADHVNRISQNPSSWWERDHVQEARKEFCNCFATISREWPAHWAAELNRLLSGIPQS